MFYHQIDHTLEIDLEDFYDILNKAMEHVPDPISSIEIMELLENFFEDERGDNRHILQG